MSRYVPLGKGCRVFFLDREADGMDIADMLTDRLGIAHALAEEVACVREGFGQDAASRVCDALALILEQCVALQEEAEARARKARAIKGVRP